ncbi:MAG: Swt1 family HEPN domain-containing protein [Anaerolineales bacterium]
MSMPPKQILAKELNISRQAVEQRRDKIIVNYGPMSELEAYGVIGHTEKKDVAKLLGLDSETLSRVRDICFRIQSDGSEKTTSKSVSKNNKASKNTTKVIRIGGNANFKDPLLSQSILNGAKEMTDIYATLYVFENSVRDVISRVMAKKFGKEWWNKLNATRALKMRQDVKGRMTQEEKNSWHGKRGSHPIDYTDIANLIDIFDEYWSDFKPFFPTLKWVETRISEISMSRNIVDHHNPLNPNDQKRVQVYFTDWCNQIASVKDQLISKEDEL